MASCFGLSSWKLVGFVRVCTSGDWLAGSLFCCGSSCVSGAELNLSSSERGAAGVERRCDAIRRRSSSCCDLLLASCLPVGASSTCCCCCCAESSSSKMGSSLGSSPRWSLEFLGALKVTLMRCSCCLSAACRCCCCRPLVDLMRVKGKRRGEMTNVSLAWPTSLLSNSRTLATREFQRSGFSLQLALGGSQLEIP